MVIFHRYVSLPKGKTYSQQFQQYLCGPPQVLTLHTAVQAPQNSEVPGVSHRSFGGQVEGEHPPEVRCIFMYIYIYIYHISIIYIYYIIISYIAMLCINMNGHSGYDWLIRFWVQNSQNWMIAYQNWMIAYHINQYVSPNFSTANVFVRIFFINGDTPKWLVYNGKSPI